MSQPSHDTLTFDRALKPDVARVFAAFSDPAQRSVWGPPSPDLNMTYTETDFRPGGRDLCLCGPGIAEGVEVETLYHAISAPHLILFTEILRMGESVEGAALITVSLRPASPGTRLVLTVQGAGLGGSDTVEDMRMGWTAALENLTNFLAEHAPA